MLKDLIVNKVEYITQLQEENQKLKERYKRFRISVGEDLVQIEKLAGKIIDKIDREHFREKKRFN